MRLLLILRDILVLYACYGVGILIARLLPFPFPASVIGMILLFVLLNFQIIKLQWVEAGASLLLRHMSLLFIPIAVGVMAYAKVLQEVWLFILLCSVAGILIILGVIGHLYQWFNR